MSIEPVAEKLEKLLKMLSSPNQGEVIAAAQAIMRTLKGAGADIHELAACVKGGKLSEADMQRIYDAAFQDGQRAAEKDKPTLQASLHAPRRTMIRQHGPRIPRRSRR
jgi:hypothetical protein